MTAKDPDQSSRDINALMATSLSAAGSVQSSRIRMTPHSAGRRESKREFAEICVQCQDDALLRLCECQHSTIVGAWHPLLHP